jgi:ornithine carbamoyltransferase
MAHFLTIDDLTGEELAQVVTAAADVKAKPKRWRERLDGRQVAMIFEKPSARTRVSFEVAVTSMGGQAIVIRDEEVQLGRRETFEDAARVFSRYVDAIVLRTFGQDRLERLAAAASIPVINALSDSEHPCQVLADLLTIQERKGSLADVSLAYIGDGNNVAHSLMLAGGKVGMDVRVATPKGFEPFPQITDRAKELAAHSGGKVTVTNLVAEAASGADVLYTDVWASMGQEDSAEKRRAAFGGYQINDDVVRMAGAETIVLHCLPAHRGEEIAADVIDGPRSVVWDQAENRLHSQKALLAHLLD